MQETTVQKKQRSGSGGVILAVTAAIITIQVVVDIVMGGEAEYFNAYATLMQLTAWLHGRTPDVPLIAGQEQLGGWALPLATAVLFGLPLLISTLLVKVWRQVIRR